MTLKDSRKRILYIFPDRGSSGDRIKEKSFWTVYERAAADVGVDFDVVSPEHIIMTRDGAFWNDNKLCPRRDVIVYDIRSEPAHTVDLWSSITVLRSLEAAGFWSAIPLETAMLCSDKFVTAQLLADSPVPVIPSVRINTGRDLSRLQYRPLIPEDWFPVFVKPSSWGRGLGCVPCPDQATLEAVLGLASGSGVCMLVQPSVGQVVSDLRVVVVEGNIVAAYDRIPGRDSHVANVSRGATVSERKELPSSINELVLLVNERIGLSYICVDLLCTADGGLWFSELEPDGAVSGIFTNPGAVRRVVGGRFEAYANRLDQHLKIHSPSSSEGTRD